MFQERIGVRLPRDEGGPVVPGPVADVEGAVGLHARAGGLAPAAEAGGEKPFRRTAESARGDVHDVDEDAGEVVMETRGSHQGDEPPHRVQVHPPEVPVPVDGGERRDRVPDPRAGSGSSNRGGRRWSWGSGLMADSPPV